VTTRGRGLALPGVDGRSTTARRFKQLVVDFTKEMLGDDVTPSPSELSLIRQAAGLAVESERLASEQIAGHCVNSDLVRTANALSRTLAILQSAKQKRQPEHRPAWLLGDVDAHQES
jgi:hypothetical protein